MSGEISDRLLCQERFKTGFHVRRDFTQAVRRKSIQAGRREFIQDVGINFKQAVRRESPIGVMRLYTLHNPAIYIALTIPLPGLTILLRLPFT